jgi:hypothetical protein
MMGGGAIGDALLSVPYRAAPELRREWIRLGRVGKLLISIMSPEQCPKLILRSYFRNYHATGAITELRELRCAEMLLRNP